MKKIFLLSEDVISKIAAGEVIERPVFAVKELIENSLDAGADSLTIQIEDSGLKSITVIDNGEGMSKEDLQECFLPHTTSKISTSDNLNHIDTFGFRGEALSSIAAISKMHLKSRRATESAGTSIELIEGVVKKVAPVGMPPGTQITIYNLFYPVPARKKFLKSSRTEFRHIVDFVTRAAIMHPEVSFSFSHNKKIIFDLPKTTDPLSRIKILLGASTFTQLLPISYEDSYITIAGFLTKPQLTTTSSQKQFLFINKRSVSDRLTSLAVKDAYNSLLAATAQPVYILFITTPHEFVDVNVHPRKEHVRFVDTQLIYDAVHTAVAKTLATHNLTFSNTNENGIGLSDATQAKRKFGFTNSYAGRLLKENRTPWDIPIISEVSPTTDVVQMHNLYLVAPTPHGIVFVDQHAAHERVLYEQLQETYKSKAEQGQVHLSKPHLLTLSFTDSELLQEHLPLIKQFGFEIEHFKDNDFFIQTIPLLLQERNAAQVISEMLEDLHEEKRPKDIDAISNRMLAYLACRAAIKAGDRLTKKQAKDLLEKLQKTPNNITCPHGRPTKVIMDLKTINSMFKRNK